MLSELQAVAEQIQREIAVESSSSAPGGEAPAAHIETPDNKLLFPNRAIWLQGQLDARKWDVNDLERQKGPSHHSGRKILKSEPVLPVVLERLARVLKVPISDIPDD